MSWGTVGLFDQLDQALILTIFSEFIDCHCYRRITIDRTRIDSIANIFGDRSRFTSQARFIKHATAFDDMSIDRDGLTGFDDQLIADVSFIDFDIDKFVSHDFVSGLW